MQNHVAANIDDVDPLQISDEMKSAEDGVFKSTDIVEMIWVENENSTMDV